MEDAAPQSSRMFWWSILAAFFLHVALCLLFARMTTERLPELPETSVPIELVAAPPQQSPAAPSEVSAPPEPKPVAPVSPAPQASLPQSEAAPMHHAEKLFSQQVLADPRSRKARESLRHLVSEERIIQLCNIEAMEQVHRSDPASRPETLVAYAMAEPRFSGVSLLVTGGAFRSRRRWYNIQYKCEVSANAADIVSFEFLAGDEIPLAEWEEHNLTVSDEPAD
ncbi:DUF930 domain-containing protein [Phyllobacterium sp. SB3]|uniref:DUF930 domain-containing protein n=1 Tax=Phyllobacterium sp. SB3 TaxID=3156073 RepID=UPI0032AECC80